MSSLIITGGTGSLGNALVDRFLRDNSSPYLTKIIIYSRDEQKQEQMYNRFKDRDTEGILRYFIGDVRDRDRLRLAMQECTYVVHAAALKIVPMLEYNPFEAVKTNIMGTQNLIDCITSNYHTRKVVFVSTDKAVYPINLYGATKLTAEKMILAANNIYGVSGPKFNVLRYGNVACSRGSVIPKFIEQIKKNGKEVTITDPNMTRFWITLDQAVDLVIDVLLNAKEEFLHLPPPMKSYNITDLARALGAKKIKYIGTRPGEKIHEDITTVQELEAMSLNCKSYPFNSGYAQVMTVKELKCEIKEQMKIMKEIGI